MYRTEDTVGCFITPSLSQRNSSLSKWNCMHGGGGGFEARLNADDV